MKIYDILLEEEACFFASAHKVFLLNLFRYMKKNNLRQILTSYTQLQELTSIGKSSIGVALEIAQANNLIKKEVDYSKKEFKIMLKILRGL